MTHVAHCVFQEVLVNLLLINGLNGSRRTFANTFTDTLMFVHNCADRRDRRDRADRSNDRGLILGADRRATIDGRYRAPIGAPIGATAAGQYRAPIGAQWLRAAIVRRSARRSALKISNEIIEFEFVSADRRVIFRFAASFSFTYYVSFCSHPFPPI